MANYKHCACGHYKSSHEGDGACSISKCGCEAYDRGKGPVQTVSLRLTAEEAAKLETLAWAMDMPKNAVLAYLIGQADPTDYAKRTMETRIGKKT